jgi:drug/metabolite transporter (DMT)-like permease
LNLSNKALPYVVLMGLLLGSNAVASRFSIGQFPPIAYIFLRFVIATAIHLALYALSRSRQLPSDAKFWLKGSIYGVISLGIPMIGFILGLIYMSSGVMSLLQTIIPVSTVLLAHVLLKDERMTWSTGIGVLIALVGAAALLINRETGLPDIAKADWRGYAWLGISVLFVSLGSIYARRYLQSEDGFDTSTIRMIAATIFVLPIFLLTDSMDLSRVQTSGIAVLAYAALVGTFFTFWLDFYINKRFGATASSESAYVVPVSAIVLGALLLGEIITPVMLIGMVLIFIGLALLDWHPVEKTKTSHILEDK